MANEYKIEKYCPDLLECVPKEDNFTDSDSDGDGPPDIEVYFYIKIIFNFHLIFKTYFFFWKLFNN